MQTLTIDIEGLTIDTGYGERDCDIQGEVQVTETGLEVLNCTVWIFDRDGGSHEWGNDHEEFDELLLQEAKELLAKEGIK